MSCLRKYIWLFLLVICYQLKLTTAFTVRDFQISDLETSTSSLFAIEAQNWESGNQNPTAPLYTLCNGTPLLGGVGILERNSWLRRTYTNLPTHTGIRVKIVFWFIDNWTTYDILQLVISDEKQRLWTERILDISYDDTKWTGKLCGDPDIFDMKPVTSIVATSHAGSTLVLELLSIRYNPVDQISFGIRDVSIMFSRLPIGVNCGYTVPKDLLNSPNCHCDVGEWPYYSSCHPCHQSCGACYYSYDHACYYCKDGYVYDGQLCVQCDPSCLTCSGPGLNQCLSCQTGDYLYGNNTCITGCVPPFLVQTNNGVNTCSFVCSQTSYFYQNGSCLDDCSFPFSPTTIVLERYCNFPCGSDYIYHNGSCYDYCEEPMVESTVPLAKICNPPCNEIQYYVKDTQTCNDTCFPPYSLEPTDFYTACNFDQAYEVSETDATNNIAPITSLVVLASSTIFPGTSWGIIATVAARMIQYTRFVSIDYASMDGNIDAFWRTEYMRLDLRIGIPRGITEKLEVAEVAEYLSSFGVYNPFIVNYWPNIIAAFIGLGAFTVTSLLHLASVKGDASKGMISFFRYLKSASSNFLLVILYSGFGNSIFFGIIELKYLRISSFMSALSLLLMLACFLGMFGLLGWQIKRLVQHYRKEHKMQALEDRPPSQPDLSLTHPNFLVLFKDFKSHSIFPKGFLVFLLMRDLLFGTCLATLYQFPVYTLTLILGLHFVHLTYLIVQRPFNRSYLELQNFILEFFILITYGVAIGVSMIDDVQEDYVTVRNLLAKILVYLNVASLFTILIFTSLNTLISVVNVIKELMRDKTSIPKAKDQTFEFFSPSFLDAKLKPNIIHEESDNSILNQFGGMNQYGAVGKDQYSMWEEDKGFSQQTFEDQDSTFTNILQQEKQEVKKIRRRVTAKTHLTRLPIQDPQLQAAKREDRQDVQPKLTQTFTRLENVENDIDLRCKERNEILSKNPPILQDSPQNDLRRLVLKDNSAFDNNEKLSFHEVTSKIFKNELKNDGGKALLEKIARNRLRGRSTEDNWNNSAKPN